MATSKNKQAPRSSEPILAPVNAAKWHDWLRAHHAHSSGVWLRIPKTGKSTLSYASALDAALAWGWIDSQKRALDDSAWLQRFTPRRPGSPWSKINCAKAEALIATQRMEAPGLAEVARAKKDGRWARAYDGAKSATVPDDFAEALRSKPRAQAFFTKLDAANRYAILYRLKTAKLPETRARRIATYVALCAEQKTLHPARKKSAR
ncbi:MAG TPA: YdeI/OmpD-associated family protein [Polyangiaceae bacterium]